MASQYVWHLKDRIVYARLSGTINEDDLRKGNAIISQYLAESKHVPIHLLLDCREIERITFSVIQIRNELHYLQHPSLGMVVIFGMTGLVERSVEFLTALVTRLTGLQVYSAKSPDEGLVFLRTIDPSLPHLLASIDVSA